MTELPRGIRECPKPSHFRYPDGEERRGMVVKEVGKEFPGHVSGTYYAVVQLIKHPDDEDTVRFGYYRRAQGGDDFRWGSQTTYEFPAEFTKELIRMAEREGIL